MFDKIFDFIESHMIVVVLGASILLFAGMQFAMASLSGGADDVHQSSGQEAPSSSPTSSDGGGDAAESDGGGKLTEAQEKLKSSYTGDMSGLLKTLSGAVWTAQDGQGQLDVAADGTFTEKLPDDGKTSEEAGALAIAAIDTAAEQPTDGSYQETDAVVVDTKGASHILRLKSYASDPAAGGEGAYLVLTSSLFKKDGGYTTRYASRSIKFEGTDDDRLRAVLPKGVDAKKIEREISAYCEGYVSSAVSCSWDQTIFSDYPNKSVTFGFTVTDCIPSGDASGSTHAIDVAVSLETGAVTVKGAN